MHWFWWMLIAAVVVLGLVLRFAIASQRKLLTFMSCAGAVTLAQLEAAGFDRVYAIHALSRLAKIGHIEIRPRSGLSSGRENEIKIMANAREPLTPDWAGDCSFLYRRPGAAIFVTDSKTGGSNDPDKWA